MLPPDGDHQPSADGLGGTPHVELVLEDGADFVITVGGVRVAAYRRLFDTPARDGFAALQEAVRWLNVLNDHRVALLILEDHRVVAASEVQPTQPRPGREEEAE
jgi:hypothetical protein